MLTGALRRALRREPLILFFGWVMADLLNVEIKIRSVIEDLDASGLAAGEPEITERVCRGELRTGEESLVLTYSESEEGGSVETELSVLGGVIRLCRRGAIDSVLEFSEGGVYDTLYSVGPYKFDMTVKTKRIRCTLGKEGGEIGLVYEMVLGGSRRIARMKIEACAAK